MNDAAIRTSFHKKRLYRQHQSKDTIVIDELGIQHGRFRADIAVVNGCLTGFEIKSDEDSLSRLGAQIHAYNAIFDRVSIVLGEKHLQRAKLIIPRFWGVVLATTGQRGAIHFETIRLAQTNPLTRSDLLVALLWKSEVLALLQDLGEKKYIHQANKATLYSRLLDIATHSDLKVMVRNCLKRRRSWQDQP